LLYSYGYLPADGQQHKTVVEITGGILGQDFDGIVRQFNRMRKRRNIFFYDSEDLSNLTEARTALKTAKLLLGRIKEITQELNPNKDFKFT